jgi:hypothetical protein
MSKFHPHYEPEWETSPEWCEDCKRAPPAPQRWEGIHSLHIYKGAQRCQRCYEAGGWRLRARDNVWVWNLDPELAIDIGAIEV